MKKAIIIIVSVLCTTSLSFAQSKKDMLLRFEEQSAAINSLNQQVGVLTAQRDQLSEQVKDLKKQIEGQQKQIEELKALIAATNDSKLVNTGWTKRGDFFAGLALVQDDVTNKYGFVDKSGKLVIPCKWKNAWNFNRDLEDLAEVQNENGLWGFIDKTGEEVIPCKWYSTDCFAPEGLIGVKNADGLWGFIDKTGRLVIPCKYKHIGQRSQVPGRVIVKRTDGRYVDVDRNGREYDTKF